MTLNITLPTGTETNEFLKIARRTKLEIVVKGRASYWNDISISGSKKRILWARKLMAKTCGVHNFGSYSAQLQAICMNCAKITQAFMQINN